MSNYPLTNIIKFMTQFSLLKYIIITLMGSCESNFRYLSTFKNRLDPNYIPVNQKPRSYNVIPVINERKSIKKKLSYDPPLNEN